ncbi:hypothetical protein CJI97_004273 [Candidozyma auris]|nr:hypothetical protein CJI97_004273 [[Candida] auris]
MAYDNSLAVGLSVGLPCFIVLMLCLALWIRNRKRQRGEDNLEKDIDNELKDDNSFNQFQDALHKPASNYEKKEGSDTATAHEKQVSSTDLDVHEDNISSSRGSTTSNTVSERKKSSFFTPPPSVLNGNGNSSRFPNGTPHGPPQAHSKTPSSYDFYDTFIPILQSHNSTAGDLSDLTQPPPAVSHDARSSASSSSNTSLIGGTAPNGSPLNQTNRDNNRSLDNLAKQLHHSQLFDKLPSRATTITKRPAIPIISNNSSTELVTKDLFQNDAINESYVVQVPDLHDDYEESVSGLPRQKHVYHQRAQATPCSNGGSKTIPAIVTEDQAMQPTSRLVKPTAAMNNFEGNFDNNVATDKVDEEEPDVVFK